MRKLGDRDDQYKNLLDDKLHLADGTTLTSLHKKELGDGLVVS